MSRGTFIDLCYLIAAVCFIVALIGLGSPRRARRGNLLGAFGMLSPSPSLSPSPDSATSA